MQAVTVLTPHGRRQTIKVDPNKTILWILEEVCKKYPDFDPDMHGLKHHNKLLDLSTMFRFAGLPNNASLEMVEAETKRVELDLVICLQLEDGTRLNGNFPASSTLSDVINQLCPEKSSPEHNPNVIYMRSEVHGDKLQTTTLKNLGLSSGGRALLRLINAEPEMMKIQANISAPLPQKLREEESEDIRPRSNVNTTKAPALFHFEDIKRMKEDAKEATPIEKESMEIEEASSGHQEDMEIPSTPKHESIVDFVEKPSAPEPEPVIIQLDDRGTIIFSLDSIRPSAVDLPDSFFDLTEADVRRLYRDLRHQVDHLKDAPLMTVQLRKLEENKKILNQLSIYKFCAIRIQLPNRYVIQTKFRTVDKIGAVMDFVKDFLVDPSMDFCLFLTPPKSILDRDVTLIEAHCVPSALLHFGCDENGPRDVLKPELYEKISSGSGASRVLVTQSEEQSNDEAESNVEGKKPEVPTNFLQSKASSSSEKLPKWFKGTGK